MADSRLWLWENGDLKMESPSAPTADLTTELLESAVCVKGRMERLKELTAQTAILCSLMAPELL